MCYTYGVIDTKSRFLAPHAHVHSQHPPHGLSRSATDECQTLGYDLLRDMIIRVEYILGGKATARWAL
jgi:hypothetical protein